MTSIKDILQYRLLNQQILQPQFTKPVELVKWFGGMQAQDYASCRHAIGLRLQEATDASVEQAIRNKSLVRTWVLRGTLHIVATKDARWMIDLLGPLIIARRKTRFKQLELDEKTMLRANKLFEKLLLDAPLTRDELFKALEKQGISITKERGAHILYRAALDKIICMGPLRGKQFTYTLFDQWVQGSSSKTRDEALAELANRYFASHGPATLQDFIWWSGLSVSDAKAAVESVRSKWVQEEVDGCVYWMSNKTPTLKKNSSGVHLLPAFDEYVIAYKDRSLLLENTHTKKVISTNGIFFPTIIVNGKAEGIWKRTVAKNKVIIETDFFNGMNEAGKRQLASAVKNYGKFMEMPVVSKE